MSVFHILRTAAACGLLILTSASCRKSGLSATPEISASEAMANVERSVSFGERFSGSENLRKYRAWIVERIRGVSKFDVRLEEFEETTPRGNMRFANIIVHVPGVKKEYAIIGAHYDTKKFNLIRGFTGANDGASGTAGLLAMISAAAKMSGKFEYGIRFVFFDGEECVDSYSGNDGLHGSRKHASGDLSGCRAMILVDMIGDRSLNAGIPSGCSPALAEKAMRLAAARGVERFFHRMETDIIDDHTPFLNAGVPSINFIDFNYGPENSFWHTTHDSVDKVSGESIKIVCDLVFALVADL